MKRTFRIPVEELIGPFRGERGAPDTGGALGWIKAGNALPFAALAFILAVTAAELMTRVELVYHLMFLGLALGIAFAGVLLKRIGMQKIRALLVRDCDPGAYAEAMYGLAVSVQRARFPKQAIREQFCGLYTANYAMALGYMGRFEEARVLAGRLLRCELTPLEEMGCRAVLAFYHYHHGETEALWEEFLSLRQAAQHVRETEARPVLQNAERLMNLSRVRSQEGAGAAYRLCLEEKLPDSGPLYRAVRSCTLGELALEAGYAREAEEHLRYALEHGNGLYAKRRAGELLEEMRAKAGAPGPDDRTI